MHQEKLFLFLLAIAIAVLSVLGTWTIHDQPQLFSGIFDDAEKGSIIFSLTEPIETESATHGTLSVVYRGVK